MPVTGLPIAVEGALNNLLTASHVSSWKLQGNGKSTTLVLKFIDNEEGAMADQHSPSRSISYKKKSSGQIRREKLRAEEYFKEKQQKDKYATDREQKQKEETDVDKETKNKSENSRSRPTIEQKEETNLENTLAEDKGTNVLTAQLDKLSEDNLKRAIRPTTESETDEKDKMHQQSPSQQSFTPCKQLMKQPQKSTKDIFNMKKLKNNCKSFQLG